MVHHRSRQLPRANLWTSPRFLICFRTCRTFCTRRGTSLLQLRPHSSPPMAAHTAKPGLSPTTVFTCMLRACTETRLTGTYRETSTALCTRRTAFLSARLAARNSSSGRVCAITCSPGPAPDRISYDPSPPHLKHRFRVKL